LISGGTSAGGIVVLLTDQLKIGASGAISASAGHAGRDVSASGGYIFVRGCGLDMGTNRVSAVGGIGTLEDGPSAGQSAKSSDGYIVLSGSEIGGTTIPAAIQLANECPR
jgi:hypothetical protein